MDPTARSGAALEYVAPTTTDLMRLKNTLGCTGDQMADLFGLAGGHQWRKYTGGQAPREMSLQMLFLAAARLTLGEADLAQVFAQMRAIGAEIEARAAQTADAGSSTADS